MKAADPSVVVVEQALLRLGAGDAETFELRADKLTVGPGEHAVLIGPSGSGKTTFLRALAGLFRPESGSIRVAGNDWTGLSEGVRRSARIRRLGVVFQHFALIEAACVLDNILLPARLAHGVVGRREARQRAIELAERLGIRHTLRRRPTRVSHGERQRAAICRALLLRPPVLIMDEPTSSLDAERTRTVIDAVLRQAEQHGATCLIATHDAQVIERFSYRVDVTGGRVTARAGVTSEAVP